MVGARKAEAAARVAGALFALVAALLVFVLAGHAAAIATATLSSTAGHNFKAAPGSTLITGNPPILFDFTTGHDRVCLGSLGTSARPETFTHRPDYTYASRAMLACALATTTPTERRVVVTGGESSSLHWGAVAAKTESRVLSRVDDLPCNCFIDGTKVKTAAGEKAIEEVELRDKVWARNLDTGKNELRTVTGLFRKHADQVMTITVADGGKVTVTEEHPFCVAGFGWVMSGDLRVGEQLAQRDGGSTAITDISVSAIDTTVYNFAVEGDHNYYVTEAQLLVHNCAKPRGTPRGNIAQNKQFNDAIRSAERQFGRTLSKDERSLVHREISGQDYGYHDIVDEVLGIFGDT